MKSTSSVVMLPFSTVYNIVTRARLAAYETGFFKVSKLPVPVISIGNITAGGTGKTPLVEWVCRAIAANGKKVCVLTRGYGRVNPNSQVVVSDGSQALSDAEDAGDEPLLLAQNLAGISAVIANPDRFAAGTWAIENLGSEAFVLDDGFQHLRLARDLNVIVIDATNPWGTGRLLPKGTLREARGGISRADCVVITRTDQVEDVSRLRVEIERLTKGVPVFLSRMTTSRITNLDGTNVEVSQPVAAFCGIGNPQSFFKHLNQEGFELGLTRSFPDHHKYTQSDVDALTAEAEARRFPALMTTAKDAVKLRELRFALPCYVLHTQIEVQESAALLALLQKTLSN